ncbi:MAG: AI-2E family transporter [Dermatophilaceae bacterium]
MSDTSQPVPAAVRATSEWAWRLLVIAAALVALGYLLGFVSEVVIPVVVAVLLAALLSPLNLWLRPRLGRNGAAAGLTVVATIVGIAALLYLVTSQLVNGAGDLLAQLEGGIDQVRDWLRTSVGLTDSQVSQYLDQAKETITSSEGVRSGLAKAGLTATHLVTGLFLSLFALFFFLYDGARIWAWLVRLFPRSARTKVASSGVVAWGQLSAYTRATILVALVDAVGITVVALVLRVPFAVPIGVLVFLGAFIPIVGALLSGFVAVILALVSHGPLTALLMLAGVLAVQQLEAHILQPFLLGRAVRVHPLAVILVIATGIVLAGIVGGLVAVPIAAVVNAVGNHLLGGDEPEPLEQVRRDVGLAPPDPQQG